MFVAALLMAGVAWSGNDVPSPLVPQREVEEFGNAPVDASSGRFRPGKGLEWKSADERFSMALGFRAMFLYEIEHDPGAAAPDPTATQEIMIRRARVTAAGSMWGKQNTYKVELAVSPRDEAVKDGVVTQTPLLTWENTFKQLRDFNLRIGQYKVPYSRERVISSSKLAAVDRSSANSEFNLDRDIGLDVGSKDLGGKGLLQYNVGIYAGEGRGRFEPNNFGMMALARVNVTPLGLFDDYEPQDFERTGPRLSVGAAWAVVDQPNGAKDILEDAPDDMVYAYHNVTADLVFKVSGFSTEGAVYWRDGRQADREFAAVGTGFMVQPGLLLPHTPFAITGRYSQILPASVGTLSPSTEVGPGLSYYLAGARNQMKVQADYLRKWSDDASAGENQGRVQLQCML